MRGLSNDDLSPLFPKGPSPNIKIVLVLLVSLGLMFLDHGNHTLEPLRSSLAAAVQPLQIGAELPQDALAFLQKYIHRDQLIEKNKTLNQKVLLLQARLQKLAALQAENDRIRALLASARSLDEKVLIAEVLAVSPDPYRHYLKLNKGTADGVHKGQALVDAHGIMGQVTQADTYGSTAVLITDANHGIPVEINRTGLQTIAQGTGKSELLSLPFLPSNADVRPGDLLVSSGLGGRYPAGYPVAKVTQVAHTAGNEFLSIQAQPTANLNRGREVLLVWDDPNPADQSETLPTAKNADETTADKNKKHPGKPAQESSTPGQDAAQ